MNILSPTWRAAISLATGPGFSVPPGSALVAYDPTDPNACLNASGLPCTTFLEQIATLVDITGNGYDATQTTGANRPLYLAVDDGGYLYYAGTFNGNTYTGITRHSTLVTTTDFDIECRVAPADWTPSVNKVLASRTLLGTGSNQDRWIFYIKTTGELVLAFYKYLGGVVTAFDMVSTANLSALSSYQTKWVRAHWNPNTGGGSYLCRFNSSDDGATWTQLGTDITGTAFANAPGEAEIQLGSYRTGALAQEDSTRFIGKYFAMRYRKAGALHVEWHADDSSHLKRWGPTRGGPLGVVTYADHAALIKEPAIYLRGSHFMNVTVPATSDFMAGMRFHCILGNTQTIFLGTTGSGTPYNIYQAHSGYVMYSGNASHATSFTFTFGFFKEVNLGCLITSRAGGNFNFRMNKSTGTAAGSASAGTANFGYLFRRGSNYGAGVIGRMAHYNSTGNPSELDLETWLGGANTRNMVLYSETLDARVAPTNAEFWNSVAMSVTADATAGPSGLVTADLLFAPTGAATDHYNYAIIPVEAKKYCLSAYFKRPASNIHQYAALKFSDGVSYNKVWVVDTATWLTSFTDVGITDTLIQDVGNGWYRLSCCWTYLINHSSANVEATLRTSGGSPNFAGANNGLYVTGVQLHPGSAPDDYHATSQKYATSYM